MNLVYDHSVSLKVISNKNGEVEELFGVVANFHNLYRGKSSSV